MLSLRTKRDSGQIAFEFLIVYSFILVVFVVVFLLIVSQRVVSLNAQQYSNLQLLAQNVASYIDQAVSAGNGYNTTIPLLTSLGTIPYNLTISSTGVVMASLKIGAQIISAQAFSSARSIVVNGTPASGSTNGIRLTLVPTTGVLTVTNLKGVIFVDSAPAQVSQLAQHMGVVNIERVRGATLDGNSCAVGRGALLNSTPNFTISSWVYLSSYAGNQTVYSEGGDPMRTAALFVNSSGAPCIETFNKLRTPGNLTFCARSLTIPTKSWAFLAATLTGGTAGSGFLSLYANNLTASGTLQEERAITANSLGIGCNIGYLQGEPFNGINGAIANLQIYNTTLQQAQVSALYKEGIGAFPFPAVSNALLAWYPFDGNANDYSGNGRHAFPSNISYENVAQIMVRTTNANGTAPTNGTVGQSGALTGFVASAGSLGAHNLSFENETSCGNLQSAFLSTNALQGINVTITGFNGNSTYLTGCEFTPGLKSDLVGWWPLDEGYGTVAHDLSGSYNRLAAPGSLDGYPGWSIADANITNFQTRMFDGNAGTNITVLQSNAYNGIVANGTVSVVAWVYEGGAIVTGHTNNLPPLYMITSQGIFGDEQNVSGALSNGFELGISSGRCSIAFIVGRGEVYASNTTCINGIDIGVPLKRWIMIAGTYDKSSGVASLYLGDKLISSRNIGRQDLSSSIPLSIGSDRISTAPDVFNGSISNVQFYGATLNQSQISRLYSQGVSGAPQGASLLGWWTIDGNTNDYSANANNGISTSSAWANVGFDNYTVANPEYAAVFNPSSANDLQSSGSVTLPITNQMTVTAWIKPGQQAGKYYNGIFRYGPGGVCPLGVDGTFQIGIQKSGVPEFDSWCDPFVEQHGPSVNRNSWNFIAGVLNGQKIDLFLNGLWMNGTLAGIANIRSGNIIIGSNDSSVAGGFFNGSISDVQVYNTTLTSQQILQLYEQGLPLTSRVNVSG